MSVAIRVVVVTTTLAAAEVEHFEEIADRIGQIDAAAMGDRSQSPIALDERQHRSVVVNAMVELRMNKP